MLTPKLKVLFACISWPPETFLIQLMKGLVDAGKEVTIACAGKPGKDWLSHPGFRWLATTAWPSSGSVRLPRLDAGRTIARTSRDVRRFAPHVRQATTLTGRLQSWYRLLPFAGHRWDVIYFPWNFTAITYMPLFDLGCPVVVSCRGAQINVAPHNPKRSSIRDGLRATFHCAAAVHCVSEAIKHEAMQYGLDPAKVWVIYPAVNPDFFSLSQRRGSNDRVLQIVTTGALIWRKGYEYALLALRRLLDSSMRAHFHIIGEGPERPRIIYTIHDLGLEGQVHLHGQVPPDVVRHRLQQADVFLLSSLSEGISNAVLEAMSCGLPVVTTDCGGMREAVTDGIEGFVVPARNPEATAQALVRLAEPALQEQMGQAGRIRVLQQFTVAHQVRQFVTMCNAALGITKVSF